jgi:undecaprenyl-diphosphatase
MARFLIVGLFQAIAILPGISRSGATISAGRLRGWSQQEAITFSFMIAIPAILGGVTLETLQWIKNPQPNVTIGLAAYLAGFSTSFAIGYLSLRALIQLAMKDRFFYFIWYCLFIGLFSLLYFNFLIGL